MKNIIKKIFIGVAIGFILSFINACEVHAEQQVVYKKPLQNYISFCNIADYSICNYSLTSTINEFVYLQSTFYKVDITKPNNYFIGRVSWQYDLSDIDEPYVSFTIYNQLVQPNVVLDGVACDTYNGTYQILNNYNGDYEFTNFPNGYTIAVCPNTKSSESWLDIYHNDTSHATSTTYSALILNWINTYDKNSSISSSIKETTNAIKETNDFLKDESLPNNASGDIGDLNSNIATNGTISSLVTMPITFLQKIIDGLNGACSPITIGELYEYNMTMPCIDPQQYIGIIWNIIDVICAGFLSFHFGKKLVSIFHKITSMKDGGLEEAYD